MNGSRIRPIVWGESTTGRPGGPVLIITVGPLDVIIPNRSVVDAGRARVLDHRADRVARVGGGEAAVTTVLSPNDALILAAVVVDGGTGGLDGLIGTIDYLDRSVLPFDEVSCGLARLRAGAGSRWGLETASA
jgi:hypothetical protein